MKVRKGFGILFGALLILCMGGCGLNSKTAETELEPETRIGVVVDSDTLNEAAETVRSLLDGWTEREVILDGRRKICLPASWRLSGTEVPTIHTVRWKLGDTVSGSIRLWPARIRRMLSICRI